MVRKSDLYKVDGDKIERKNQICPRCGEGVFMVTMVTELLVVNADTLK